jgi:NAD-dependent SIR2 family protein deacetylase
MWVFFGGTVPRERVENTRRALEASDGLLVVGSSLQVYSGFRFCRFAAELCKPIIIINRGKTRADDMAALKIEEDAGEVLTYLVSSAESASSTVGYSNLKPAACRRSGTTR